jgi:TatD DNase family protein
MMEWVDAHTHLDAEELYPNRTAILARATQAGVNTLLLVNSEASQNSFLRTLEVALLKDASRRYVSLGIHPHHASLYSEELENQLLEKLKHPAVISFGEIGLDYYYDYSPKEVQIKVLRRQLHLSREEGLPVMIHCREAYKELAEILRSESTDWKGMIHCFTGNSQEAAALLELGFYISFSGIITFRSAAILQEAARFVPLERILVETDAPYLAPVPKRGKVNEPAFLIYTGEFVAQLKKVPVQEFARKVIANFEKLFPKTCVKAD